MKNYVKRVILFWFCMVFLYVSTSSSEGKPNNRTRI